MAQVNAGRVRFVSRGEYNNSTQYYLFDLVNYEGSSYVAIGNTLGNIPTNTTYWQLVAEKGKTGSVGPEGPQGVGIASITKTATEGLVDTYTITYTNGTTSTFQVTNGEDGDVTPTEFNALKADVEDLRDNQIIYPSLDQPALEGTNIHVEDAAKARLYEFEMTKESTQETTTGKNLFNNNATPNTSSNSSYAAINNGVKVIAITNNQYAFVGYVIKDLTNDIGKTVRLKCNFQASGNNQARYYIGLSDANGQNRVQKVASNTSGNTISYNVTSVAGEPTYLIVVFYVNYTGTAVANDYVDYTDVIVTIDNEDMSYEEYTGEQPSPSPEFPQSVKTVKGYRNLFDKDNVNTINAFIAINNDKLNISSTTKCLYISCEANTDYTITKISSARFKVASSSVLPAVNVSITRYFFSNDSATFATITTDSNANYLIITYYNSDDDTLTEQEILNSIMIVEGDQVLPYVPYGNNYIAVNVSDGTNTNNYPIPLNNNEIVGIGDYKDELKVDKSGHVFINKKTGKVVLNGSETGWYSSGGNAPFGIEISNALITINNDDLPNILVNNFTTQSFNGSWTTNSYLSCSAGTTYPNRIRFRNTDISSLNDFKTWLSTHNTTLYYALETPELIDLQTTVDLKLFKGVNNITNSEDGNMRIRYVESIDTIINEIEDIKTRLRVLEEE